MTRPCLSCGRPTKQTRCPACARQYDATRRPSPTQRYGQGYQRRHKAAVDYEPWCHWPVGCHYAITVANPLTAQHLVPASRGGASGPLVAYCKAHNSAVGNREG